MPSRKKADAGEHASVAAFLAWGSRESPLHVFTRARIIRSEADLRSRGRGVERLAYKAVRGLLRWVRVLEEASFPPFDVTSFSILEGDNEHTWVERCVRAVNTWLEANGY